MARRERTAELALRPGALQAAAALQLPRIRGGHEYAGWLLPLPARGWLLRAPPLPGAALSLHC